MRKVNCIKRVTRRYEQDTFQNLVKRKGEGDLKMQLIKSLVKTESRPDTKKSFSQRNIQLQKGRRANSALLRTFSNPKILSSENRQLIKGTKI